MPLASSTVITPSLPTFCIASEIMRPISTSPLAAIVPTCAVSAGVVILRVRFFSSSTTAVTAASTPRLRSIGFMPAATALAPSRTIDCASTVAVVVPSPAMSLVLLATSRTICAPMFSNLSASSISLATVTPSLVIRGAPKLLSSTTLRPFGPSVTFTASARMSMPRSIRWRASPPNRTSLAAMSIGIPLVSLLNGRRRRSGGLLRRLATWPSMMPMMSDSFMIRSSSPSSFTSVPDHLPNSTRSPAFTSSGTSWPCSLRAPGPTATTSPSIGFSFAVSGMMIPPAVFSSASSRRTTTRSCRGRNFIRIAPGKVSRFVGLRPAAHRRTVAGPGAASTPRRECQRSRRVGSGKSRRPAALRPCEC